MVDITVIPGTVKVNNWTVLIDYDDVRVIHVDLMSKYPGRIHYISTSDSISVCIPADRDTLNPDPNLGRDTEVWFTPGGSSRSWDWAVVADAARYTVQIVFYRLPGPDSELWCTRPTESDSQPRSATDPG